MTSAAATDFDRWLAKRFGEIGAYTVLVVLVRIGQTKLDLLRSTHLHVIGNEITWTELATLFGSANVAWDGAAFFAASGDREAPLVADVRAKQQLSALLERLSDDRLVLNEGWFFDRQGRQLHVEEVAGMH